MKNNNPRQFNDLIEEHQVHQKNNNEIVEEVDISLIQPNPEQPRKHFDDDKIDNLALSIKQNGLFQPIILKKNKNKYTIIAGERRFRAFQHLNIQKIPAIVRQYQNNKIQEIALIENIQREDLNPIEEARAYKLILDNSDYKNHELALRVGKSRSHIVNMVGLLKLPNEVQDMVEQNILSMGHARSISKIRSDSKMIKLANKVVTNQWSVRQLEKYISETMKENVKEIKTNQFKEIETMINGIFGVKSTIKEDSLMLKGNASNITKVIEKLTK